MNAAAVEPLWSDLQLSWLQAMGHVVYLDRSAEPVRAQAPLAVTPQRSLTAAASAEESVPPISPRRAAPQPLPGEATAMARPAVPRRTRVGLPDRLQIALLRACAANPEDPQIQQLMASWPLEQLRGNPAAKRALWPQLRALRRKVGA